MSRELVTLRDHAREMAETCDDDNQAALWTQIADEIDNYLEEEAVEDEGGLW